MGELSERGVAGEGSVVSSWVSIVEIHAGTDDATADGMRLRFNSLPNSVQGKEKEIEKMSGGQYWARTSDLLRVKQAL